MLESLDPRIKRLPIDDVSGEYNPKDRLDQFETYQVFIQLKEGKPYEHAGIVHAPDIQFAQVFAKEQFSRRPLCNGLWVVRTQNVKVTPFAEGDENIYDIVALEFEEIHHKEHYEIFHLKKRGKQHVHQGTVLAGSYDEAIIKAKEAFSQGPVLNIWVVKENDILPIHNNDKDIWGTLSEKYHRDVVSFKSMDKIKKFKEDMGEV